LGLPDIGPYKIIIDMTNILCYAKFRTM